MVIDISEVGTLDKAAKTSTELCRRSQDLVICWGDGSR